MGEILGNPCKKKKILLPCSSKPQLKCQELELATSPMPVIPTPFQSQAGFPEFLETPSLR